MNPTNNQHHPQVHTVGLVKHYGAIKALDGIDLRVFPGDLFGLLGPNGAGKTTTIRILAGLVFPTAGEAWLGGVNLRTHAHHALKPAGFVMDTPAFYPHLTGRQNLQAVSHMLATPPRISAAQALSQVGLSEHADRQVKTYSLGMKRRLDIGRTLLADPEILILDEPTSGLDPMGAEQVRQLLTELVSKGKTVLFSSHLLHDVEQLCNRVAIIDKGKLLVQDQLANLLGSMPQTARLRFAAPEEAAQLLAAMPHNPLLERSRDLIVVDLSNHSLGEILTYLEGHGLPPLEASRMDDLQGFFLKLTGERHD